MVNLEIMINVCKTSDIDKSMEVTKLKSKIKSVEILVRLIFPFISSKLWNGSIACNPFVQLHC